MGRHARRLVDIGETIEVEAAGRRSSRLETAVVVVVVPILCIMLRIRWRMRHLVGHWRARVGTPVRSHLAVTHESHTWVGMAMCAARGWLEANAVAVRRTDINGELQ